MNASEDSANDVTEMPKIFINGERIRRTSMTATFTLENTSAPPSIDTRTTRSAAIGEQASTPTATLINKNSAIQPSQRRGSPRRDAASGVGCHDSSPTSSSTDIASRDAGPYSRNSHML